MNKCREQAKRSALPAAFRRQWTTLLGILAVALVAIGVSSCNSGPGGGETTELEGGRIIQHIKTGNPTPNPGDLISFHAYVRNGDSLIFSTRQQGQEQLFQLPKEKEPGSPPNPIEQGLAMMGAGDSATVVVDLDSMPQKPRGFENANELFYDIAVLNVQSEEAYNKKRKEDRAVALDTILQSLIDEYKPGTPKELKETDSGLEYLILEEGAGEKPQAGQQVKVHYRGVLMDGTTFDSSLSRGEPIDFPLGQGAVIPGWDEGIALLQPGGKAILVIPPDLAYGQRGAPPVIPPNADLAFYVELVEVGE
ncbi:MAG: FKBP-type peptidyl-prolyl cis-trans isomerase [Lewinellaceae bacterium]|nr:FKBP-type peptidyl-prolyl cis-trans isomerase [Lewinellaceae bacterium]